MAEWMGALALGVLWVNVLLIAAAALKHRSELGRRLSVLRAERAAGRFVEGEVTATEGERGFAERRTTQVGRAMTVAGPDRILFTDKRTSGSVGGGTVRDAGGSTVRVAAVDGCDLWVGHEVPAAREPSLRFEDAWQSASTSRGVELDVVQRVGAGARVWLAGEREGELLRPTLVATACPFSSLARGRRVLGAAALGALLGGACVTALVLWPPLFGTVSTVGGALGLAFFLLVQPAAVAARNAARTPDRQPVGGVWQRS